MSRYLLISQVFPPDPAAVGQYFDDAARALAAKGSTVTVLTANRGYDRPEERYPAIEERDGLLIRRLPFSSFGKASIPVRIFAQLSFLVQCIVRAVFSRKLDGLLISTSPPMAAIVAVVAGTLRPRLKVHYWVMDLNPDQSIALGAFGPRHPLVLALDWLNRRILKRADSVVALDRFMAMRLRSKLGQETKRSAQIQHSGGITVLPPWPLGEHLEPVDHDKNPFRQEHGWHERFVVMYSGNHSLVHPLTTLLDAAERLADDPRFLFVFIGGGKGKQAVEDRIKKWDNRSQESGDGTQKSDPASLTSQPQDHQASKPPNLVSLPYQPLDSIRFSLSAADLHIVSLGEDMSGIVHPCKVYGALGTGRPILCLGPEESYLTDILKAGSEGQAPFGWAVQHGDVDGCVTALRKAADLSADEHAAVGNRARELVEREFNREKLLGQFLEQLRG